MTCEQNILMQNDSRSSNASDGAEDNYNATNINAQSGLALDCSGPPSLDFGALKIKYIAFNT